MTYDVYWQDIPTMAIHINIKITTHTITTTITHTATTIRDTHLATTTNNTGESTPGIDTESCITWYFIHNTLPLCSQ